MAEYFDYIVVGGGVAGLTIASRLSENPTIIVLVLEAGGTGSNNEGISIPGLIGSTLGSDINWKYFTVPQEGANQRKIFYPRGKVLGGSSAINLIISTRAEAEDYNAIEGLGNPGWGWSEILRASKKSEKLIVPPVGSSYHFNPSYHGTSGPVSISFPKYVPPQFEPYFPAIATAGHLIQTKDPFEGKLEGACIFPSAIDEQGARVTSATAYYFPYKSRSNLVVRTDCEVDKLIVQQTDNSDLKILGVEYNSFGASFRVNVNKEVIMSAGSIGTPAILERSGIGKEAILQSLKIPVALDLEGVGSNLSDHPAVLGTYPLKPGITSADNLSWDPAFLAEHMSIYKKTGSGLLSHAVSLLDFRSLKGVVSEQEMQEGLKLLEHRPSYMSAEQFKAVVNRIMNGVVIEYLLLNCYLETDIPADKDTSYLTIATILQHPLSRGSSHINSQDPSQEPSIDPGYFRHPFDVWLTIQGAKHARKIMSQPQFSEIVREEQYPGPSVKTDGEWSECIRTRVSTSYHPFGTCSMLPKCQSGVVDPDLKVYGTQNLRIVDASVLPMQISAHPAMTVYALAEKAAELVLANV